MKLPTILILIISSLIFLSRVLVNILYLQSSLKWIRRSLPIRLFYCRFAKNCVNSFRNMNAWKVSHFGEIIQNQERQWAHSSTVMRRSTVVFTYTRGLSEMHEYACFRLDIPPIFEKIAKNKRGHLAPRSSAPLPFWGFLLTFIMINETDLCPSGSLWFTVWFNYIGSTFYPKIPNFLM